MLMSIATAPLPDAQLFDQLADFIDQPHPDERELKRREYSIEQCIKDGVSSTDLSRCHTARAMMRLILRDGQGALDAARHAVRLQSTCPETVAQLLMVLRNVGAYAEAGRLADRARLSACTNTTLLREVVLTYLAQFRGEEALNALRTANGQVHRIVAGEFDDTAIERRIELMREEGYTAADLQQHLACAVEVICNDGQVSPLRCLQIPLQDGSTIHDLYLDVSAERCAEIDWMIIERLVERFNRAGSEVRSISCLPLEAYFEMTAAGELSGDAA